jgi:hypothetical protein
LNQLQKDLTNLKIKNNKEEDSDNSWDIKIDDVSNNDYIIDEIPEIINIPIENDLKYARYFILNACSNENDDSDTTNNTINLEHDIAYICKEEKITGKIIDNALKSEKTLLKIFDNFNPALQPNHKYCLYK